MPYLRAIRQPRLRWIMTADHVIPPAAQLAMAQHAQAHIVKVDASHLSMISHPTAVTRLIVAAAHGTQLKGQRVVMVAETGKEPTR